MAAHRVEPAMPRQDKPANKPMTAEELGLLKLWIDAGAKHDSATGTGPRESKAVVLGELLPGFQPINAVVASADGARIADGGADSVLFVWNGQNSRVIRRLDLPPAIPPPRAASARW
jgi:hypothetical protein